MRKSLSKLLSDFLYGDLVFKDIIYLGLPRIICVRMFYLFSRNNCILIFTIDVLAWYILSLMNSFFSNSTVLKYRNIFIIICGKHLMLFKKNCFFSECFHSVAQDLSCKYMAVNENGFILIQRGLSGKDILCFLPI